nr:immunoglobulin light chain junction region [Macaca mulatta]
DYYCGSYRIGNTWVF